MNTCAHLHLFFELLCDSMCMFILHVCKLHGVVATTPADMYCYNVYHAYCVWGVCVWVWVGVYVYVHAGGWVCGCACGCGYGCMWV